MRAIDLDIYWVNTGTHLSSIPKLNIPKLNFLLHLSHCKLAKNGSQNNLYSFTAYCEMEQLAGTLPNCRTRFSPGAGGIETQLIIHIKTKIALY